MAGGMNMEMADDMNVDINGGLGVCTIQPSDAHASSVEAHVKALERRLEVAERGLGDAMR